MRAAIFACLALVLPIAAHAADTKGTPVTPIVFFDIAGPDQDGKPVVP